MSKGSRARPLSVDKNIFDLNWDKIFKKKKPKLRQDNLGKTCPRCKQDTFQERQFHDDMDGILRCSCGNITERYND